MPNLESRQFDPAEISDAEIDAVVENADDLGAELDAAFENIAPESAQKIELAKVSETAEDFAVEATDALSGKTDGEQLKGLKGRYLTAVKQKNPNVSDAEAMRSLQESLKSRHEAYFSLGNQELASEIDSFARSLETTEGISTAAGQDFMKRLNAGEFKDIVDSNNALGALMKESGGKSEAELTALNAEFNNLLAAAQDRFTPQAKKSEAAPSGDFDFSDEDIGSAFDEIQEKPAVDISDDELDAAFDNIQEKDGKVA